jgi:hypothetical protein
MDCVACADGEADAGDAFAAAVSLVGLAAAGDASDVAALLVASTEAAAAGDPFDGVDDVGEAELTPVAALAEAAAFAALAEFEELDIAALVAVGAAEVGVLLLALRPHAASVSNESRPTTA